MTVLLAAPPQLVNHLRNNLRTAIEGAIAAGHDVEVDMSETGYVDTAAIGMLLRATRQARELGRRVALRGVVDETRHYFRAAQLIGALELI